MGIFHSFLYVYQRVYQLNSDFPLFGDSQVPTAFRYSRTVIFHEVPKKKANITEPRRFDREAFYLKHGVVSIQAFGFVICFF